MTLLETPICSLCKHFRDVVFPLATLKRIMMVNRWQSYLRNMISAYLFLATKEFFLNRETKKLTSLSSDILVATIRHFGIGLND